MLKQKINKKFWIYFLIILICDLIQNIQGLSIEIFGARCFLLLPVSIILSMGEDEKSGIFIGLFSGLLWDLTSGVHLGFNSVYIMIMCYISSAFVMYLIRNNFVSNFIFSSLAIFVYCFIYWLFFIIIKGVDGGEMTIFSFYIPSGIYTLIITPFIYFAIKAIKKRLN